MRVKGLTLTEILVVLLIISILAILATPAYITYITQKRLISAAEGLYDNFLLARSNAITKQTNVYFSFQTGSNWCYGFNTGSSCTCSNTNACNLGQVNSTSYTNVTLSLPQNGGFIGSTSTFDYVRGIPSNTGKLLFTGASGENITVSLNLLGLPKICSSTVGGYSSC